MKDNIDQIYEKYFDTYYAHMMNRKSCDPTLTKQFLRELIDTQYIAQGNNWEGRGAMKDAEYRAMIAAYEVILENWDADA